MPGVAKKRYIIEPDKDLHKQMREDAERFNDLVKEYEKKYHG